MEMSAKEARLPWRHSVAWTFRERGGFSQARPCTVIYFAYGVLADTILNFQLGGISGGIAVFKRRPASHAPPVAGDLSAH